MRLKSDFSIRHYVGPQLVLLLVLTLARGLRAEPVSVDDCVAAAFSHSAALAAFQARIQAASEVHKGDLKARWPGLTISDQASYSSYKPEAGFSDGPENMANAELSQDLQAWISSPAGLSQLQVRRSQLLLAQARTRLRREVVSAYDGLMLLTLKAQEGKEADTYVDSHIKDIEHLKALGVDVELDLLRAQSQRLNLDLIAASRDAELKNSLARFRSVTGLSLGEEDFQPNSAWFAASTQNLVASKNFEFKKPEETLQGQLADLDADSAKLATRGTGPFAAPSVKVGLSHAFQSIDPAAPVDQAYASLEIDAFDWGQRASLARQRQEELISQEADTQDQLREVNLAAGELATDRLASLKAYNLSVDLLDNARRVLDIGQSYYRQGKIKETDLLSVFSDYQAALEQRDAALQSVLEKKSDWDALWDRGEQ